MSERNNEQRLAVDQPASVSTEQKQDKKADLLSFLSPTHFVDLPSKGKFYSVGHPLHNKTSVEIKQMTAKEEDLLTSESYIKKGIVLEKFADRFSIRDSCDGCVDKN